MKNIYVPTTHSQLAHQVSEIRTHIVTPKPRKTCGKVYTLIEKNPQKKLVKKNLSSDREQ